MTKPTHLPIAVPSSGSALATTSGTQRIATRMADDLLLNVVSSRERSLAAQRRYRIGDYEFREADYEQIQRWAQMLRLGPEAVVEGLAGFQKEFYRGGVIAHVNFHVQDGSILALAWDLQEFPISDWQWVDRLKIEQLGVIGHRTEGLPTFPRSLRELYCSECELIHIDLTPVPRLTELDCSGNKLRALDLTPVPGLIALNCSDNRLLSSSFNGPERRTLGNSLSRRRGEVLQDEFSYQDNGFYGFYGGLTHLDLTPVPGLTTLDCCDNTLTNLDLTPVPGLTTLYCSWNELSALDLTPVPGLTTLECVYTRLTHLDLTPVPGLIALDCKRNSLHRLDLTPVPGLTTLDCCHNSLTNLDLMPVPGLKTLDCSSTSLTHLDLTPVPGLTTLDCRENHYLTHLDLTPVPGLTALKCSLTSLTHLDLTPVPGLEELRCDPFTRITGKRPKDCF